MDDTRIIKRVFEGRVEEWRSIGKPQKPGQIQISKFAQAIDESRCWKEGDPEGQGRKWAVEPR